MTKNSDGIFRLGTSGIVVPGTIESRPEEFRSKSRLNYYASIFNTVEINSSFKKVPRTSTFERWATDVPGDFQFTVKLWREITHAKKLAFDPAHIPFFLNAATYIGDKRGCLLIQFPASITVQYAREVEHILQVLQRSDPGHSWRLAIEFRHTSWYTAPVYTMLDKYEASVVLHDMPASKATELNEKAGFAYFRFHGPTGNYRESYSTGYLEEQAQMIRDYVLQGRDVYAYFNNTMGSALENARTLKLFVQEKEIKID